MVVYGRQFLHCWVAPREGRVSRNEVRQKFDHSFSKVAPREGRVSRNLGDLVSQGVDKVAPREGRVSRNLKLVPALHREIRRAPRGACE